MRPPTHPPAHPYPPATPPPRLPQGTSRGNAKVPAIVERLRLWGINHLYVIGGNGGNAAAHAIAKECTDQGVACNVVGVPKSIDNDIQLVGEGRGGGAVRAVRGRGDKLDQPSVPYIAGHGAPVIQPRDTPLNSPLPIAIQSSPTLASPLPLSLCRHRRSTAALGLTRRWKRRSAR